MGRKARERRKELYARLRRWNFNADGRNLYLAFRSQGMNDNAAGNAVIAQLGSAAMLPPGATPVTDQEVAVDVALAGPDTLDLILSPVDGGPLWAPGFGPEFDGEPPLGVQGQGETFVTDEGPVVITFAAPDGGYVSPVAALQALILLIKTYPKIMDAIKAAFEFIIRIPGRKAKEMNKLAILTLMQELPESHRKALAQYEGGLSAPIKLGPAGENVFLVLILADAINISEYDFEEHLVEELIGHVLTAH